MTTTGARSLPPVRVASDWVNMAMVGLASILAIIISLMSRADSQETTMPAVICPSSMRLAMSMMPLSTPRQALLKS